MQDSNDKMQLDCKVQVTFPESSEDHRLQLVGINGAIFAILHSPLESNGPIRLHCEEWSLVLLASIKSKADVEITAINVICLNEITSREGTVKIEASNRLVKLAPPVKSMENRQETGEGGVFQLDDNDPAAFLNYFQLFHKVVSCVDDESPDNISEAQQKFITSLCLIAAKIEGKTTDLTIPRVLGIWDI